MSENANHDPCPLHLSKKSIPHKADYKRFQAMLNEYCPDKPVTEAEAEDAFRNLGEFVGLLVRINDRIDLVKMENFPDERIPFK
jgi:hypothetical protein